MNNHPGAERRRPVCDDGNPLTGKTAFTIDHTMRNTLTGILKVVSIKVTQTTSKFLIKIEKGRVSEPASTKARQKMADCVEADIENKEAKTIYSCFLLRRMKTFK